MGSLLEELASRYPDNSLVKRLPPQEFYTAYLPILFAPVSAGARDTLQWLACLCYQKMPIKSRTRGHFEGEFREMTETAEKTVREHVAELVHAGFIKCYRTSRNEFLLYFVGIVPLPDEGEQLTLLDVGELKTKPSKKQKQEKFGWRNFANTIGENPPTPQGQVGRSASLKPTYLPNTITTSENLTVKVGENSPTSRRKSAKPPVSAPAFGENPPKLKREKGEPTAHKRADTSGLSTEALAIFQRLEMLGFWDEPAVDAARHAALNGYTPDEVVVHAQTIIEKVSAAPGINDVLSVSLHRLTWLVQRPNRKKKASTRQQIHADQQSQQDRRQAYYASTTPAQRLVDSLLDMKPSERVELLEMLPPDQREAWAELPRTKQEALLAAPQKRLSNTG